MFNIPVLIYKNLEPNTHFYNSTIESILVIFRVLRELGCKSHVKIHASNLLMDFIRISFDEVETIFQSHAV